MEKTVGFLIPALIAIAVFIFKAIFYCFMDNSRVTRPAYTGLAAVILCHSFFHLLDFIERSQFSGINMLKKYLTVSSRSFIDI